MLNRAIYIIGAGEAGTSIAKDIKKKSIIGNVVAFLDDDSAKIGKKIANIPVLGPINDVVKLLHKHPSDEALIAIPSASHEFLRTMYQKLELSGFRRIRIVPSSSQIADNRVHLALTREINPQDLLGRDPIHMDIRTTLQSLKNCRVLITGAGGSIGSTLATQLLYAGLSRLYLLGHGENSIYEIYRELKMLQSENIGSNTTLIPIIGELQDKRFVASIMKKVQADYVFHTAAHKHVVMTEHNPVAAVLNNVIATLYLAQAAKSLKVQKFVLISTDKAVNPTSVYGVTKRLAEDITIAKGGVVVRFANVLGSRGSIMPLFQYQIEKGGPVTITHKNAKRFFMTIPEATALVIQASSFADTSTRYLLEMGEQLSIQEIAEQMIRFYGYQPHTQIKIKYIGLRPGEKKEESLLAKGEHTQPTKCAGIHRIESSSVDPVSLQKYTNSLLQLCTAQDYPSIHSIKTVLHAYAPTLVL